MKVKKFRKLPVEIEALQFKLGMDSDIIAGFVTVDFDYSTGDGEEVICMSIPTLEGELNVSDGDWIIKGVKGEFYPCKPEIFAMTYEEVPNET